MLLCTSSVSVINVNDGIKGDQGVSISSQKEQWYLSDSNSKITGGSWSYTEPTTIPDGKYLWGRWENTMSDGSKQYSAAVYRSTIQGLKNITDSVNNSITQKVWKSDITNAIDDYDGTTAQSIRDNVSQLTTDLSGITTRVGQAETTLTTKADGSTVTTLQNDYSAFKQTMNGFKTTVESSYATIEDLNGIKVSGNNLYHIRDEVSGYIGTSGGISSPSSTNKEKTSSYIPVVPGATYIIQSWATPNATGNSWLAYQFYADESADDKIGNLVSKYGSTSGSGVEVTAEGQERLTYKVVAPENAKYIRVSYRQFEDGCCMVEQSTIPSEYAIAPVDIEYESDAKISSVRTIAEQAADKFTWLVKDGTSASNFTLTSRVAELISPQVVIKDPAGSATIITGGKIQANAITTDMLDTNAIKSHNYQASPNASSPYSAVGTFLDLATGTLYMPQFGVDGVTGAAYFNGTVNASAGKFGDDTSYWNIETVIDYNAQSHAALVGTGSPYLQTGNWQVSDNAVATRKYTSTSDSAGRATYYKDAGTNTFYDVGMKIPTSFTKGEDNNADRYHRAFFYQRKYTGDTAPSVDGNWQYPFIVDNEGRVYCTDLIIIGGGSGTTYLPLAGGTITGDLTVNGKFNAKGAVTTTLMLQTNLGSTSAAQLTGNANAIVTHGVTGTLGVGNGGTGQSSWTANGIVYASNASTLAQMAVGTSGQVLKSNGNAAPGWVNQSALSVGEAVKATQDGNGDVISSTYRKLDNGIFDSINVTELTSGNLIVTGAARFTNGIYGTASEASKVTNALKIQLNGGTTEGTNQFTFDGSADKNINITRSSIGLGAAADKAVDTSIAVGSSSTNLPTSAAVASFVEGKGYVTSSGVTSITLKAGTGVSLDTDNTAITSTGTRTISLANSYGDAKNPYGTKTANYVLAGPSSGSAAAPTFRKLVAADIPSITKSKISDFPTTWALTDITGADDLKAIEGLTGASGILKKTAANTWALSTVISGLSINNDVLTVTKSDGTTQDLTINITGQVVSGATILSDASGNPISEGSTSKPVYFSNGIPVSANTIPTIALNGGNTTSPSFYAPTGAGTSGQYLKSNGSGAPTWATFSKSTVGLGNVDNTADANKNVLTATKFAAAQSVTLTGDTTGTASSQAGWSIATTTKLFTGTSETDPAITTSPGTGKIRYSYNVSNPTGIFSRTNNSNAIITLNRHPGNYDSQIGLSSNGNIYYRVFSDKALDNTTDWKTMLDSSNYNTYSPKLDGTGATGTWGIDISGNATNATYAKYIGFQDVNEIRFDINTKPSSAKNICVGYKWSDGTTDAKISRYIFYNGASQVTEVQASTFHGDLSGNASSATKATQDSDGNAINTTYLKLSGGTMTGTITTPHGKEALHFPSTNGSYGTGVVYGINGNEALSVITKNAVTSFMVVHGSDPATWENDTWYSAAPTLQTKNKSVYVNELIAHNTTPTYNFKVNGTAYLGGEVRVSHNNADTESVSLKYNDTMKSLDFIFN